jgi:hypothetical protein
MLAVHELQALPHGLPWQGGALHVADANENRDWRIFADFAPVLIGIARPDFEGVCGFRHKIRVENADYSRIKPQVGAGAGLPELRIR